MDPAARGACLAVGGDQPLGPRGRKITVALRDNLAPGALDSVRQHTARFTHIGRHAQTTVENPAYFELLRRKADARALKGGSSPGTFAAFLRMQNASQRRAEMSSYRPVIRGAWGSLRKKDRCDDYLAQWVTPRNRLCRRLRMWRKGPRLTRATTTSTRGLSFCRAKKYLAKEGGGSWGKRQGARGGRVE